MFRFVQKRVLESLLSKDPHLRKGPRPRYPRPTIRLDSREDRESENERLQPLEENRVLWRSHAQTLLGMSVAGHTLFHARASRQMGPL